MEASMGGCGDEWDFNIFFCDNDELYLGPVAEVYSRSNPNLAFHQYINNNDDYHHFDRPQENMNKQAEEAWLMPMDNYSDSNDFFVSDFSESVDLTNKDNNNNCLAVIEKEGRRWHDEAVNSVTAAVVEKSQLKRKSAAAASKSSPEYDTVDDKDSNADVSMAKNPKKKPRVVISRPDHLEKMKKKKKVAEPRRRQKQKLDNGDEGKMTRPKEEASFLNDDDNGASNGNRKAATASKAGAALDSQSLYARKRRERINERLKILQNLVPNGTKVDISTMLEEAVIYVKFLQLQIKLLSSEDMWMYAPIAYNGMDIGRLCQINLPL